MSPIKALSTFRRDESGAVAIIVSLMMIVLMGFVALGVDVASLYTDRARLQSASDLTAVSAMANPDDASDRASTALLENNRTGDVLTAMQFGRFHRNPAIPYDQRFTPLADGTSGINAVKIELADDSPLHFARVFSEDDTVRLNRWAMATRTGAASFSLSSYLAKLEGDALNTLLMQRYGATAQIDVGTMSLLADASISLGDLVAALPGAGSANPAEVLNAVFSFGDVIGAAQDQLPPSLAGSLTALRTATSGHSISVDAIIGGMDTELGLTITDFLADADISALDLIRAGLGAQALDPGATIDLDTSITGVLSVNGQLTAGEPPAQSGWIAMGEERVTLHRAAARLALDISAEPALLSGLGTGVEATALTVPLYVELAGATATLEEVSCSDTAPGDPAASFLVGPTPLDPANGIAVAALYLGALPSAVGDVIDPSDLEFADLLTVSIIVELPLLPDVTLADLVIQARSHLAVGTSSEERISFTRDDLSAGNTTRSYGSEAMIGTAVNGLLSPANTEVRIKPDQGGLINGILAPVVNSLLANLPTEMATALAGPIDSVIEAALAELGLKVGVGELALTGHHCERIQLVQ